MSEEIKKTAEGAVAKEKIPAAPQGQPVAAELKEADLDDIAGGSLRVRAPLFGHNARLRF